MARAAVWMLAGLWLPFVLMGQTGADSGSIRGTVVDSAGVPVPGAEVDIVPAGPGHHLIRQVIADQEGRFTMGGLGWWEWCVRARKESDGYPDTSFSMFANGHGQSVKLSPQAPNSTVVVTLGPKAGLIRPTFFDAETGPVPVTAGANIWLWDDPGVYYSTSFPWGRQPSPDLLIPAAKPIGIELTVPGYDAWRYPSGSAPGQPITLDPGERSAVRVELRRSAEMRKRDARLLQRDLSEAEVVDTIAEMFVMAPNDRRTVQEVREVVRLRGTNTLPIAILGRYVSEPLVSDCLDSASPEVRKAALAALYRRGVMVSHLSGKLRAMASNPNEEPEARVQAQQLLRTVH